MELAGRQYERAAENRLLELQGAANHQHRKNCVCHAKENLPQEQATEELNWVRSGELELVALAQHQTVSTPAQSECSLDQSCHWLTSRARVDGREAKCDATARTNDARR